MGVRALVVLVLLAAGCRTPAVTAAEGRWFEVRSPRFRVWTKGDPEQGRRLVADLERFHEVLAANTTAEPRDEAPPLRVFLATDRASFQALTGVRVRGALGAFRSSYRGNYAVAQARRSEADDLLPSARAILFHEYTHYMMAIQGAQVPSWYNEGFAEYMASTEFQGDGSYTLGCPPQYRLAWMQALRWVPMARVMEAENVSKLVRGNRDSYAQSWSAVHYFNLDSQRQKQLADYLQRWAQGQRAESAVRAAFGMDYAQLDELLRAYAHRAEFACLNVKPAREWPAPKIEVRPLSDADAHYHVGDIVLEAFGPTDAAIEVLEGALAREPKHARALVALARAHWLTAERAAAEPAVRDPALERARDHLARAEALLPDDPEVLAVRGHVRTLEARALSDEEQPGADAALAAARSAYRKAIRRNDALAEAYYGLGLTYLLADDGSQEAEVVLEVAAFLLPLETQVAWAYARLQHARGNSLKAAVAGEYVLRWTKDDARRAAARELLAEIRSAAGSVPAETEPPAASR